MNTQSTVLIHQITLILIKQEITMNASICEDVLETQCTLFIMYISSNKGERKKQVSDGKLNHKERQFHVPP